MAKGKRDNNNLQNNTHKTKDRATRSPLKTGVNAGAPEGLAVPNKKPYPPCKLNGRSLLPFTVSDCPFGIFIFLVML
jgi:hypothetical protein